MLQATQHGMTRFDQYGSLLMEEKDVHEVVKAVPNAKVMAIRMEAVNYWNLSRENLKKFAVEKSIGDKVIVPDDGDKYTFQYEDPKHLMFRVFSSSIIV